MRHENSDTDRLWDSIIIGGGAAGFFAAITCAENIGKDARVLLLERTRSPLQKVKISGGGRCNVTHDCPDARRMSTHYPRGERSLIGPLTRWGTADTIDWFEQRGVTLKTEADGRVFPTTNDSQTIIDCLLRAASDAGVELRTGCGVDAIVPMAGDQFELTVGDDEILRSRTVLLATGGTRTDAGSQLASALGHHLAPPVASLFAFKIKDSRLDELQGLSVTDASVRIPGTRLEATGPLLVTHQGLSGPGILRISAWGARELADLNYDFPLAINWLPEHDVPATLAPLRKAAGARLVLRHNPFPEIPRRLWERLVTHAGVEPATTWSRLPRTRLNQLAGELTRSCFQVSGKSTNKEEFVTCGGVLLKEIDLKKMASKLQPGLYFAGEVMNVDGITGGFNFQNAWCSGHHAGTAMAEKVLHLRESTA